MEPDISILAKDLPEAKQRLRSRLGWAGAHAFAEQCLRHVIRCVLSSGQVNRVRVVTNGTLTAAVATEEGANVWFQRSEGLGNAAQEALQLAPERHRIILMADLPCLTPTDVQTLVTNVGAAQLTLVADRHLNGLNGLVVAPGVSFFPELGFGDGLLRNRKLAEGARLNWNEWHSPGLAFDCDNASDFEAFLAARTARI